MTFKTIPGLMFNGVPVGYDDTSDTTPVVTPPTPSIPVMSFVAPNEVATRIKLLTKVEWGKGHPSFYSLAPLTDQNVWLICFTPTDNIKTIITTAEYGGPNTARNWRLIRNRDGKVVASSGTRPIQGPGVTMNSVGTIFSPALVVDINEPYTFAIWNAVGGVSSAMVGQLYQ